MFTFLKHLHIIHEQCHQHNQIFLHIFTISQSDKYWQVSTENCPFSFGLSEFFNPSNNIIYNPQILSTNTLKNPLLQVHLHQTPKGSQAIRKVVKKLLNKVKKGFFENVAHNPQLSVLWTQKEQSHCSRSVPCDSLRQVHFCRL